MEVVGYLNGGMLACVRCFRPIHGAALTMNADGVLVNYHPGCVPLMADYSEVVDPAEPGRQKGESDE